MIILNVVTKLKCLVLGRWSFWFWQKNMMSPCLNSASEWPGKYGRGKHVGFKENRSLPVTDVRSIHCIVGTNSWCWGFVTRQRYTSWYTWPDRASLQTPSGLLYGNKGLWTSIKRLSCVIMVWFCNNFNSCGTKSNVMTSHEGPCGAATVRTVGKRCVALFIIAYSRRSTFRRRVRPPSGWKEKPFAIAARAHVKMAWKA